MTCNIFCELNPWYIIKLFVTFLCSDTETFSMKLNDLNRLSVICSLISLLQIQFNKTENWWSLFIFSFSLAYLLDLSQIVTRRATKFHFACSRNSFPSSWRDSAFSKKQSSKTPRWRTIIFSKGEWERKERCKGYCKDAEENTYWWQTRRWASIFKDTDSTKSSQEKTFSKQNKNERW